MPDRYEIPKSMTAIGFDAPGSADLLKPVVRDVPLPEENEVLIKVVAAGINRPDILQRRGFYPPPQGSSDILGLEVSGTVVATGPNVDEALMGKAFCALVAGGGYAEYVVAPLGQCLPVPDNYDMVEAAALPETVFTVWSNLFERAYVVEGDTVLVHGGTSGIGTMAISLCNLFGIRTIVTCGSDAKCTAALKIGAAHAINYATTDFVEAVREITDGKGVQAVLDIVGGDYVARNISCLADDGRHVSIATQRGVKAEIPLVPLMQKRLTLTGSTLRPRSVAFKTLIADELARTVWPFVEEGNLRPVMDRTFPLAEAAAAHARMEAGEHVGKMVLVI